MFCSSWVICFLLSASVTLKRKTCRFWNFGGMEFVAITQNLLLHPSHQTPNIKKHRRKRKQLLISNQRRIITWPIWNLKDSIVEPLPGPGHWLEHSWHSEQCKVTQGAWQCTLNNGPAEEGLKWLYWLHPQFPCNYLEIGSQKPLCPLVYVQFSASTLSGLSNPFTVSNYAAWCEFLPQSKWNHKEICSPDITLAAKHGVSQPFNNGDPDVCKSFPFLNF